MTAVVEQAGIRVIASNHATARAQERLAHLHGCKHGAARYWLERTAVCALQEGRKARRLPRWCVREIYGEADERTRLRQEGLWRFAWDDAQTVALLLKHTRDRYDNERTFWLIVTALAAGGV